MFTMMTTLCILTHNAVLFDKKHSFCPFKEGLDSFQNSLIHKQYLLMIPRIKVPSSCSGLGQPLDEQHCVMHPDYLHCLVLMHRKLLQTRYPDCTALTGYWGQDTNSHPQTDREIPDTPCSVLYLEFEGRGGAGGCKVVVVVLWRTAFMKFSKHVTLSPKIEVQYL